jgi:hypothetical protein
MAESAPELCDHDKVSGLQGSGFNAPPAVGVPADAGGGREAMVGVVAVVGVISSCQAGEARRFWRKELDPRP